MLPLTLLGSCFSFLALQEDIRLRFLSIRMTCQTGQDAGFLKEKMSNEHQVKAEFAA